MVKDQKKVKNQIESVGLTDDQLNSYKDFYESVVVDYKTQTKINENIEVNIEDHCKLLK